jgi:hypothetical protein
MEADYFRVTSSTADANCRSCCSYRVEGRLEKLLAHRVGRRQAIIEVKDQGFRHVARDGD